MNNDILPPEIVLEACCGSADDAAIARQAGVNRIELNSALFLGGLTPTAGEVAVVVESIGIETIVMIRPREGGFHYSEREFDTMLRDIDVLRDIGVNGFVFGVLNSDGTVDIERNRRLLAQADGVPCVFHRAFDVVPDRFRALEELVELGFVRVLTTGGRADVLEATAHVCALVEAAGDRITILPGGVKPYAARSFVQETGVTELHVAGFHTSVDTSCRGNTEINFGGALYPSETAVARLDGNWISEFGRAGA